MKRIRISLLVVWIVVLSVFVLWRRQKPKPQPYQVTTIFITNSTDRVITIQLPPEYSVIGTNKIAPTGMAGIVFEIIPDYGGAAHIIEIK